MMSSGGYTTVDDDQNKNSVVSGSVPVVSVFSSFMTAVRYFHLFSWIWLDPIRCTLAWSASAGCLRSGSRDPQIHRLVLPSSPVRFVVSFSWCNSFSDCCHRLWFFFAAESKLQTFPPSSESQGKIAAVFRPPSDADGDRPLPLVPFLTFLSDDYCFFWLIASSCLRLLSVEVSSWSEILFC